MSSRFLMIASALVLGLAGLATTFAPAELLAAWGSPTTEQTVILVQLLGALYFSFALLNWTAKEMIIGGIYARPVSLGNFLHFAMGALALGKQGLARGFDLPIVVAAVIYAVLAVLFGTLVFGRAKAPARP